VKKCKDCKWFHLLTGEQAKRYKKYGSCIHLTMLDDIIFLQAGKEIAGGYIVHENYGCNKFEIK